MTGVVFENVVAYNSSNKIWDGYACWGLKGAIANGTTSPIPSCFNGGPNCLEDNVCRTAKAEPCCSGRSHSTTHCAPYKRCGCLQEQECSRSPEDCCSGECIRTV